MTFEQIEKNTPRHSGVCMARRNQGETVAKYLNRIDPDMDSVTCARCKNLHNYLHDITHTSVAILQGENGKDSRMSQWNMKCLICNEYTDNNLVRIQEHAMHEHGYTQEDHRRVTKREIDGGYIYTFPDGQDWLEATRTTGGTSIGDLS
jgi:hypothetical protein